MSINTSYPKSFSGSVLRLGLLITLLQVSQFAFGQYRSGDGDGFATQETSFFGLALPLPLDLITFTANASESDVALEWTTQNEVATAYFGIERSDNGAEFETIGRVTAAGTSTPDAQLSYDFDDRAAPTGTVFYRLKMVDLDESFTYSPIEQVRIDDTAEISVGVFPNPSNGAQLNFRVNGLKAGQEVDVDLIDQVGRQLSSGTFVVEPGAAVNFPLERRIPNGIYTVRVTNPTLGTISQKLSVN